MEADQNFIDSAREFDALMSQGSAYVETGDGAPAKPPTTKSVMRIQDHFDFTFPKSFVKFAMESEYFGYWFASIGDDYQSYNHIIRVNSRYQRMRRRREGKWTGVKPENFVLVHADFHDECLGFNLLKTEIGTDEHEMQYWYCGYAKEFGDKYENFPEYMLSLLDYLKNNRN